jgi:type I restriction enzyme R subunit
MVDREFQAKTNHLVQQQVGSYGVGGLGEMSRSMATPSS